MLKKVIQEKRKNCLKSPRVTVQYGLTKSIDKLTYANEQSVQWLINQAQSVHP